jgi:hypothetical protein
MTKRKGAITEWLIDEESVGSVEYDIDADDRRRVNDLEYVDENRDADFVEDFEQYLGEVSFEEQKLELDGTEYTALRVYESGADMPIAAEVYEDLSEGPVTVDWIDTESPEWIGSTDAALTILNRYDPQLEEEDETAEEVETDESHEFFEEELE